MVPAKCRIWVAIVLLGSFALARADTPEAMDKARMDAVIRFAETVLKHGRDTYGEKHTPVFTDTLDVDTVKAPERMYIFRLNKPSPRQWQPWQPVVSANLAYQGNLMRALAGLSNLTGDPKYKDAYKECIRYHFAHYQGPSGMLHMGHHRFVDLIADDYDGDDWPKGSRGHEMKGDMPYYPLFWETDPEATRRMLDGHWNSHIKNWHTMDFTRHGYYHRTLKDGVWDRPMGDRVKGIIKGDLTFYGSFTDIAWAGGSLALLTNDDKPRLWTERLLARYIDSVHEKTGIPPCHHTKVRDFAGASGYPNESWPEYAMIFSGPSESMMCFGATMLLRLGESFGDEKGDYFRDSVRDYLKAYAKHAYNHEDNTLRTILYDGKDLSTYPRKGEGASGLLFPPFQAHPGYMVSYALCYRLTKDREIWSTLRTICRGNDLGDIGVAGGEGLELNAATDHSDPLSIFSLIELFQATDNRAFLQLAQVVANNALAQRFDAEKGLFVKSDFHKTANLNVREPLAFLRLEAALKGNLDAVPTYGGSTVGSEFDVLRPKKVLPYSPEVSHCWYPNTPLAMCDELVPKSSSDTSIPSMSWYRGRHQGTVVAVFPDILKGPVTIEGPADAGDAPNLLKGIVIDSPHTYTFSPPGGLKMKRDFHLTVLRGDHVWQKEASWYPSGRTDFIFDIAKGASFTFQSVIYEYYHAATRSGLLKNGKGTVVLTADHSPLIKGKKEDDRAYQGDTVVNAGHLIVNNKTGSGISPKSAVHVRKGGTLGGEGAVGNGGTSAVMTVHDGGAIAPGNYGDVGMLTLRDGLKLEGGAKLVFELGSTSDLLKVTGGTFTGSGDGGVAVSMVGAEALAGGAAYDLIDWKGAKPDGVDVADFVVHRASAYKGEFSIEGTKLRVTITGSGGSVQVPVEPETPAPAPPKPEETFTWTNLDGGKWVHRANWANGTVPNGSPREWAHYAFENPLVVSGVDLYWLDDGSGIRVPASWGVFYRADGKWKPLEATSEYGVAKDQFNKVDFKKVETTGLKLEVALQEGKSAGVLEWRVR